MQKEKYQFNLSKLESEPIQNAWKNNQKIDLQ